MACLIGGATMHSWGGIVFKDKRGVHILPQDTTESEQLQCGALRWHLIDEVEAAGAEITGQLEHSVRFNITKNKFKYDQQGMVRPFGGVNTCFLGDFWQ